MHSQEFLFQRISNWYATRVGAAARCARDRRDAKSIAKNSWGALSRKSASKRMYTIGYPPSNFVYIAALFRARASDKRFACAKRNGSILRDLERAMGIEPVFVLCDGS
jgi:hypothetical protein